jgi:hypothetical protein
VLEFRNPEIPASLTKVIHGDFLYKMTMLLKDNPAYLSIILMKLDRLSDEPEEKRQNLFKEIIGSIERDMPKDNNKTVVI